MSDNKTTHDQRTPLFLWMYDHHQEFAEVLRNSRKPDWKARATQFVNDGLISPDRRYDTVRQTWNQVRKALAKENETASDEVQE